MKEDTEALFICRGYSAYENGFGGIAIGFFINYGAIDEYTKVTGKSVNYGVFAVLQDNILGKDVFDSNGELTEGVISADVTTHGLAVFELKIVGFLDNQKDVMLAMGAYVVVSDENTTEYSYMQAEAPLEGQSYSFISFNGVLGKL